MTERQLKTRRRIVLVYLYSLFALWPVYRVLTNVPIETERGMRIASCAFVALALGGQLGFMWFCTLDARLVGKTLPQLARIGIFFGWPLGVASQRRRPAPAARRPAVFWSSVVPPSLRFISVTGHGRSSE
jgi:hypothetical protein